MLYLLLCAFANVGILLCFSLFKRHNLNTFHAIVFNYVTCVITGVLFLSDFEALTLVHFNTPWVLIALCLGAIFIMTFYLMALTTQRFSITVSSIAAKMSLVIPVLVSLLILKVESKEYTMLNYLGIIVAFPAIILSSIKGRKQKTDSFLKSTILLPITVFIFGGVIDSAINYTNFKYLNSDTEPIFPIVIFSAAALLGILIILARKSKVTLKSITGGVVLGIINYFSIYFLLKALTQFNNDGAILYPLLNVAIITFSAAISFFIFDEKLSKLNKAGILLAMMAIFLISYQELSTYF